MAVKIDYKEAPSSKLYKFGVKTDGSATLKELLGGKGANLAEMCSLGLPVPSGFTIPCSYSVRYNEIANQPEKLVVFQLTLWEKVKRGLTYLEECFGYMPLVSVRSGARVSMPGMMDTILNVGLTTETLDFWTAKLGARATLDSYRRLIQMYASVAMDVPMGKFEEILSHYKAEAGVSVDSELSEEVLTRVIGQYKKVVYEVTHKNFPDTLDDQLKGAIGAVFRSWNNARAVEYRKIHGYSNSWGTAVTVQAMVFGNLNDNSCTGVVFTRNPSNGLKACTGEFLINAQGEDVVAGIRTPLPIAEIGPLMGMNMGNALFDVLDKLEAHYKDMQDVEFTVQEGELFLLQTRNGKRSPLAAFQIAYDMANEGLITEKEAIARVNQGQLLSALSDQIDPKFNVKPDLVGIAAGGGVVTGQMVFSAEDAVNCTVPCVLVTKETDPDDIAGMNASVGILTAIGGLTSHAAVVARGMNKACVVGCTDLDVVKMKKDHTGQTITIDGSTGHVWIATTVPVVSATNNIAVKTLIGWAAGDGVVERVTFSTRITAQELIIQATELSGKVHIDTATFDVTSSSILELMNALMAGLAGSKVSSVFLDLTSIETHMNKSDVVFDWMFGAPPSVAYATKLGALSQWGTEVLSKLVLIGLQGEEALVAALVKKGAKVSGKVATFADLLSSTGPIEVDDAVIKSVFGSKEAFEQAKKMIEQATGKKLDGTAQVPVYWYDFLSQKKEVA